MARMHKYMVAWVNPKTRKVETSHHQTKKAAKQAAKRVSKNKDVMTQIYKFTGEWEEED